MELSEFLALNLKDKFGKTKSEAWREGEDELRRGIRSPRGLNIRDCYEIQKILRSPDASLGKLLDKPCSACGQKEVYCGNIDLGGVDNYDNYWHICLHCLDARHTGEYSGFCSTSHTIECPFCHR